MNDETEDIRADSSEKAENTKKDKGKKKKRKKKAPVYKLLPHDRVWTIENVGTYLQCSVSVVYKLMEVDGFPRAIRLPSGDVRGSGHRKYDPDEIKAWAKSLREPR